MTPKKMVALECGHWFDADKVPHERRKKVDCPGGCGWRRFEVVVSEQSIEVTMPKLLDAMDTVTRSGYMRDGSITTKKIELA